MGYKLMKPTVTAEELKELRDKGLIVRLRRFLPSGDAVYSVNGYELVLEKRR